MKRIILIVALLVVCSHAWASVEPALSEESVRAKKSTSTLEETTNESVRETLGWKPESGNLTEFEGTLNERFPSDSERREDRNARY